MTPAIRTVIFCWAVFGSAVGSTWAEGETSKSTRPRITISKETTFLTGPLDAHGNVDYIAAINARFNKRVTPKNNAAVLFWKTVGPKSIPRKLRKEFYRRLGISPLPDAGAYFIPLGLKQAKLEEQQERNRGVRLLELYDKCMEKPWNEKQLPKVSEWLKANAAAMRSIERASHLPRFYTPIFIELSEGAFGVHQDGSGRFIATSSRNVARAFTARAMLRIGTENVEGAIDDLLTLRRMSRLLDQQPSLITGFVAHSLRAMSFHCLRSLLATTTLKRNQIRRLQRDLNVNDTAGELLNQLNTANRCYELMTLQYVASGRLQNIDRFNSIWFDPPEKMQQHWQTHGKKVVSQMVDWNSVLQTLNSMFDRAIGIAKNSDRQIRKKNFRAMTVEYKKRLAKQKPFVKCIQGSVDGQATRNGATAWFGIGRASRYLTAFEEIARQIDKDRTRDDVVRFSLALAIFHLDHKRYPKQLSELKPRYINELPIDRCDGQPMKYRREPKGYLLYSSGSNGEDEGGHGFGDVPYGDDISVRVR